MYVALDPTCRTSRKDEFSYFSILKNHPRYSEIRATDFWLFSFTHTIITCNIKVFIEYHINIVFLCLWECDSSIATCWHWNVMQYNYSYTISITHNQWLTITTLLTHLIKPDYKWKLRNTQSNAVFPISLRADLLNEQMNTTVPLLLQANCQITE